MPDVTLNLWSERAPMFVEGDLPDPAAEAAREACRFEKDGHEYSEAWKQGKWDGYVELFRQNNSGKWFFPVGLLSKVTRIFDLHGVNYEIEGLTLPGRGEVEYEWPAEIDFREYQADAVSDALASGSGIISMPTGGGKTLTGLRLIHELRHPALVMAHTTEIA